MKLSMPKERGPSISVIAGISERIGLVYFDVFAGSNNSDHFLSFLEHLKLHRDGRSTVVLDNLKIHKAKKLEAVYDEDFRELYLPPYSSPLNPIEWLWAMVKQKWSKQLHQFTERIYARQQQDRITEEAVGAIRSMIGRWRLNLGKTDIGVTDWWSL